nr:hypothetical protein [Tanacetum cinerariifolium]
KEGCATWDGGNSTWGGRAKVFGTVSVCLGVQERAGGEGRVLAGRFVEGYCGAKDKQEKDKIGQKREAWQSREKSKPITVKRARKNEENICQRRQICNSYKVILKEETPGTVFEIHSKM